MRIWPLGGSGEQGRACFAVSHGGATILLDAGVKRAPSGDVREVYPRFELLDEPPVAVMLSHAHEDHAAALPLVPGQRVPVYTTAATIPEARTYCRTWLRTVANRGEPPSYADGDVERLSLQAVTYGAGFEVAGTFRVRLGPAGHLPGSAWMLVEAGGKSLLYTGDWCADSPLLRAPDFPTEADALLVDASYGDAERTQAAAVRQLLDDARDTAGRGGSLLLPLPRLGRSQEMLLLLDEHASDLPPIWTTTAIFESVGRYRGLPDLSDDGRARLDAFDPAMVRIFADISELPRGATGIFLATDGMLTGGPAVALYERIAADERSLTLLSGHQARGTLGWRLLREPQPAQACRVGMLPWKVHPDWRETRHLLQSQTRRPRVFPIHAEPAAAEAVAAGARALGLDAEVLAVGDERFF